MKIISAKTAGFCMGVKRAVDLALEQSSKTSSGIHTLGPLIHNRQTTDMLRQRGVEEIKKDSTILDDATILIRAHGVPPSLQKEYVEKGHTIIDGTCPKVKTVHKVIERHRSQGYSIVVTGDEGHAEVIGLMGYAGDAGYLIQTPEDVALLPDLKKVCLVSQTTFDRTLFDTIATKVKERFPNDDTIIKKTICAATDQRQAETERMAKMVDALIVVGGKESANTQRLAKISRDIGTPTQLVETEEEIDWESISRCKTVGVTAGASTPNWMIKRVQDYLQFMDQTRKHNIPNLIWVLFDILANLNVFVSAGAVAVYYASCRLQGYDFTSTGASIAFLYFLSMYLWNSLASIDTTQHLGISRYRFYNAHKKLLFALAGVSVITLIIMSVLTNKSLLYLMIFATFAGSVYHLTIVPRALRPFLRYKNLKDIPTSRDLFVALAWGTVLTFIPHALDQTFILRPSTIATFSWFFTLAYLRSLIFDLRDIEGDRIMGRETLITIIGEKRARKAIHLIILACITGLLVFPALMGVSTYFHQSTIKFLFQIPVLIYVALFVKWNPRIRSNRSPLFNFLADSLFYLAGFGALVATIFIR